jgi:hypothetical protein
VTDLPGVAIAVLVAYLYALAPGGLLLQGMVPPRWVRMAAILTMFTPLLAARDAAFLRAMAEVLCLDACLKIIDYSRQYGQSPAQRSFREYCYLLVPFPLFLAVLQEKKRLAHVDRTVLNVARILFGAAGVASGFALALYLNQWPLMRQSFLLEHVVKVAVFIFTVECGSRLIYGIERLAGFDTTPLVKNVFLSLTVAEFWLRWNHRVHRWLGANLFRPVARRFGRVGGVVAVFGFSGLFHEIAFDVATARIDGYQLAFFLLQIPMVLLSDWLGPAWRGSLLMKALTYLLTVFWMTATSMLFLRGVDRVFPFFYASEPWLP